jgi:hypothetical protein
MRPAPAGHPGAAILAPDHLDPGCGMLDDSHAVQPGWPSAGRCRAVRRPPECEGGPQTWLGAVVRLTKRLLMWVSVDAGHRDRRLQGGRIVDAELLDLLESQHRQAEDLIAQPEEADDAAAQQPLVEQLVSALEEHMAIEEQDVNPNLGQIDADLAEEANVEHGLTREGLAKLQSMIGQPGFGAVVEVVKGGVSHHVEEEENEAFPKLRESLGLTDSTDHTKEELYEQAKQAGVEGRSTMSKDELAEAVTEDTTQ